MTSRIVHSAEGRVAAAFAMLRASLEGPGPTEREIPQIDRAIREIAEGIRCGAVTRFDVEDFWSRAPERYLFGTCMGHAFRQPHGYAGDFEIIDAIHTSAISDIPYCGRWDRFFHGQKGAAAVRNRKCYLHELLAELEARHPGDAVRILNLGSGPCRDLLEYFEASPESRTYFVCVDQDPRALKHAEGLLDEFPERFELRLGNVLRYRDDRTYDLVWCSGVMDYLVDPLARRLLSRARTWAPRGEVVIGNFSEESASREAMEITARWFLEYRSPQGLIQLAVEAGAAPEQIHIEQEPTGTNLFLRIEGGPR